MLCVVGFTLGLFLMQDALWDTGEHANGLVEEMVAGLSVAWALPFAPAVFGLVGLLMYRRPDSVVIHMDYLDKLVSFRVVSRGQNSEALLGTVANIRSTMAHRELFRYVIEVVTDLPIDLDPRDDLVHYVVPNDYVTSAGSLYKARALQYAVEVSELPDEAWIMHLDEESHLTESVVDGIQRAVTEEETSGRLRIGQGAILYLGNLDEHPFLSLADMLRTGDDFGRFHLQHRLGITIFGLHGSFILVRNDVEKQVGFDFGPEGSITEDAFWALVEMKHGYRSRWVDGYIVEQAPSSALDFIKQRRRWFAGLIKVVRHAPVPIRWRILLGLSTLLWAISWVGLTYTYMNVILGFYVPILVRSMGNFAFAVYATQYVLGLRINLADRAMAGRPTQRLTSACLYVVQVVLIPLFSILEGAGVVYALFRPEKGFHVIDKNGALSRTAANNGSVTALRKVVV